MGHEQKWCVQLLDYILTDLCGPLPTSWKKASLDPFGCPTLGMAEEPPGLGVTTLGLTWEEQSSLFKWLFWSLFVMAVSRVLSRHITWRINALLISGALDSSSQRPLLWTCFFPCKLVGTGAGFWFLLLLGYGCEECLPVWESLPPSSMSTTTLVPSCYCQSPQPVVRSWSRVHSRPPSSQQNSQHALHRAGPHEDRDGGTSEPWNQTSRNAVLNYSPILGLC